MSNSKKILFQLSGSISCFKSAQVISILVQNGHEVKCVATKNALRFIGEATLEGLTGSAVFSDSFQSGRMMDHINLARWADIFVLCPATANTINKLSRGIAGDVIGQLFLAKGSEKPYLIFPAMNHEMYSHPATQEALSTLAKWGVKVMSTGTGHQACGEVGLGRLLEPNEIVSLIENKKKALKILITAGATREPIDEVRFISNVSSGNTAATLADFFLSEGHHVTYVAGQGTATPKQNSDVKRFTDFQSLFNLLKNELTQNKYDLVVHASAVSDYSVSQITSRGKSLNRVSKLNSDIPDLSLKLKRNDKIITEMKKWSPKTCLVAFKLTSGATEKEIKEAVKKLATDSRPDLVVHNDLSQMKDKDSRMFRLSSGAKTKSLKELAKLLLERSSSHDISP
jgi:phosphopantothenoylcysteine decarboxylase/phosphopantothenate--cysteine ligase